MKPQNRIAGMLDADSPSLVDDRTGLYNREGFISLAQQLMKLAARTRREILLVRADIDGLKDFNDKYGPAAGDGVLSGAADLLLKTFRKSDVVSCFGADDFLMMTIETRKDSAGALTSRLKENLDRHNASAGRFAFSLKVKTASIDPEAVSSLADLLEKTEDMLRVR